MKWLLLFCSINLLLLRPHPHFDHNDLFREISTSTQDLKLNPSLLEQRYTYLGQGSQMVVFASDDGVHVLKIFKGHHKKRFKLSRFLASLRRSKTIARIEWQMKFLDTCRRYEMALDHLKEETGLVLLHFAKTETPLPVTLFDQTAYRVDLANLPFIIQKRALLAPEYFRQNPTKHTEAKQALKDLFTRRLAKGFSDPRQTLTINYGFIGDTPVQLDVGKIEPFFGDQKAELKKIHNHVDDWASRF